MIKYKVEGMQGDEYKENAGETTHHRDGDDEIQSLRVLTEAVRMSPSAYAVIRNAIKMW